jgi:hypothetical protein
MQAGSSSAIFQSNVLPPTPKSKSKQSKAIIKKHAAKRAGRLFKSVDIAWSRFPAEHNLCRIRVPRDYEQDSLFGLLFNVEDEDSTNIMLLDIIHHPVCI